MGKLFEKIRPIAGFIGIGLLGLHLILSLVSMIGFGFGAMSLVRWFIELALVGALIFAFVMKRFANKCEQLFNVMFVLLLAYYAVRLTLSGADYYSGLGLEEEYGILYGEIVLGILSLVAAVGAMALFVLKIALPAVFDKPLFKMLILALVAGAVAFGFLAAIFFFIGMGQMYAEAVKNGYGNPRVWPYVIECINQNIVLPSAFLFGLFIYGEY